MIKLIILSTFCILGTILITLVYSDSEMGPADLFIKRIEECEQAVKYPYPLGIEISKVNRSHSGVTSCLELGRNMDRFVTMNVSVAKWGDGGWKPNQINYFSDDSCKTMAEHLQESWETFLVAAGAEAVTCPLKEGKYCVDKLVVDMAGSFPNMIYGDLRVDAEIFVDGRAHRCVRLIMKSEPQKPKNPEKPGM